MRHTVLAGIGLTVAVLVTVALGSALELDLVHAALPGLAAGVAVAVVPHGRLALRIIGFVAGVLIAWVGFVLRAGVLPDTDGGRAVAFAIVALLVLGLVALTGARLPLWAPLVGVAVYSASYETTFTAAPAQVLTTSVAALTSLGLCAAVGLLVGSLTAPAMASAASADTSLHIPAARTGDDSSSADTHGTRTDLQETQR